MASFVELKEIIDLTTQEDLDLRDLVEIAMGVAVDDILGEGAVTSHDERLQWATRAGLFPQTELAVLFRIVVIANRAASQAVIRSAAEGTVQTAVDAVITEIAIGTYQA